MQLKRGFTLVELMVTIAVVAIITTIAIPSFQNMILRQNLNKSTRELVSVLNNARAQAALQRRDVEVVLETEINNAGVAPDTSVLFHWMPSGQAVLKAGSPTTITFQLNGLVKDSAGNTSFVICDQINNAKLSRTVSISKMGVIQQPVEGNCS
ncbi:GspH/FimT family pseudopilin [Acinetobacter radioresistens]|uniref:GspH/FimT family pseudopilin n=1 Tax=Acinetobacter radioresistens TaxID=40216 RepID=UPI0012503847|nr:GspH/FimT family pseudopilin [Acinetobacter radioresistens]MCU4594523.1 GspH/FimT family pseudopilin [Acinetobacter radioresistens]